MKKKNNKKQKKIVKTNIEDKSFSEQVKLPEIVEEKKVDLDEIEELKKSIEHDILNDKRVKEISRTTLGSIKKVNIYSKEDIQKLDFFEHKALFQDAVKDVTSLTPQKIKKNKKKMIVSSVLIWTLSSIIIALVATLIVAMSIIAKRF